MKQHVIFDLDGTLIDSAPSILESFAYAFATMNITPSRPLDAEIIGPPLMQTLATLSGQHDTALLQALAGHFKQHYDSEGYKKIVVFAEVENLLRTLNQKSALYIATNKRHVPTVKIMEFLGWTPFFKGVFALDSFDPPAANKAEMIQRVLIQFAIASPEAVYIGDRLEDGLAADQNQLEFVMVNWGYAAADAKNEVNVQNANWQHCATAESLLLLLTSRNSTHFIEVT